MLLITPAHHNIHAFAAHLDVREPDEEMDEETIARLMLVENEKDGFALAEKDMELRGFGDLSEGSDSQSGNSLTLFVGLKLKPSDMVETKMPSLV
jgi:ATP-dependent DNA helicase RecG